MGSTICSFKLRNYYRKTTKRKMEISKLTGRAAKIRKKDAAKTRQTHAYTQQHMQNQRQTQIWRNTTTRSTGNIYPRSNNNTIHSFTRAAKQSKTVSRFVCIFKDPSRNKSVFIFI